MTFSSVRIAVIGAGDFGRRHIDTIAGLAEFTLVGVADRDLPRAQAAADAHGVRAYDSLSTLLNGVGSTDGPGIDAVVIATPPAAHAADLRVALARGIHILAEKPVVQTAPELDELDALSTELRALIVPAHVSRFLASFATLKSRMRGERIRSIRALRVVPAERLVMHGEIHPAVSTMVHDFDLIRALVTSELTDVSSTQSWVDDNLPHPQIVTAQLRFDDGTIATVENSWTLQNSRRYIDARFEVVTDTMTAALTIPTGAVRIETAAGEFIPEIDLEGSVYGIPAGALANELRYFAAYVRGETTEQAVTLDDALWSVRLGLTVAGQRPASVTRSQR